MTARRGAVLFCALLCISSLSPTVTDPITANALGRFNPPTKLERGGEGVGMGRCTRVDVFQSLLHQGRLRGGSQLDLAVETSAVNRWEVVTRSLKNIGENLRKDPRSACTHGM
eukprot:2283345-Rhodomonas_salina.1